MLLNFIFFTYKDCKICSALWNQNDNSSMNIYKITNNTIHKRGQPMYLSCLQVVSDAVSVCDLQRNEYYSEYLAIHTQFT